MDDLILRNFLDRFQYVAFGSLHPHQQGLAIVGMRCCNNCYNADDSSRNDATYLQNNSNNACEASPFRGTRVGAHGMS